MIKIFTSVKKVLKGAKWVLLLVDTLQYFNDEAEKRGLTGVQAKNDASAL